MLLILVFHWQATIMGPVRSVTECRIFQFQVLSCMLFRICFPSMLFMFFKKEPNSIIQL